MGLVAGVVAFNAVLTAVGYALLYPALRGRRPLVCCSYAGVALLVGVGAVGVALCLVAPTGVRIGFTAFAVTTAALAGTGLAAGLLLPELARARVDAGPRTGTPPSTVVGDAAVTIAAFALIAILGFALIGGFRSSPWLDDTWYFWLPKGRAL
ncbi:MAG: hypothetical protein QOG06_2633, partial [Gaiellaceae bacterium]|nr:hypothetical protein [Gaiellaceae bacterium]